MRTSNWTLIAAMLASSLFGSMSAAAQQSADAASSAQPTPAASQAAQPAASTGTPASAADASAQPAAPSQASQSATTTAPATPAPPAPEAAPTTMDQVVTLFIAHEHALIKALANRTPVVETYLQNLTSDPQLGPVPAEDHYFLGRMDMGETVDRKDYLKEEDKGGVMGMQEKLLGGFHKLYKVQYQPL